MNKSIIIFGITLLAFICNLYSQELKPFGKSMAYVIEDKAPVYSGVDKKSKLLVEINLLQFVNILSKTNIIMTNNSNVSEWFYIDSGMSSNQEMVRTDNGWKVITIKGWIERKYLAGKSDFKPVDKIDEMFITVMYPENSIFYHLYTNGSFKSKTDEDGMKSEFTGKIYRYKNILSIGLGGLFIYCDRDGRLLYTPLAELKVETNKSKFPF